MFIFEANGVSALRKRSHLYLITTRFQTACEDIPSVKVFDYGLHSACCPVGNKNFIVHEFCNGYYVIYKYKNSTNKKAPPYPIKGIF